MTFIEFLWALWPTFLFSSAVVSYNAYMGYRENRPPKPLTVDQDPTLARHRDILADLDREFPAALALPAETP